MKKLLFVIPLLIASQVAQAQPKKTLFNALFTSSQVYVAPPTTSLTIAIGGQSNAGTRSTANALAATAYSNYPGTYSKSFYIDNGVYTSRAVYTRSGSNAIG